MQSCVTRTVLSGVTFLVLCVITIARYGDHHTWPEFRSVADNGNKKMNQRSWRPVLREDKINESDDEWYYRSLDPYNIYEQMKKLSKRFPYANISIEKMGRTVEFNDLVLLKITEKTATKKFRSNDEAKYVQDGQEKKIIFIVHGLSVKGFKDIPALSDLPTFEQLLHYYFEHLDVFDIFLIPIANPDGVTVPKVFWDKNVSPQTACPGVNLDRNFNVAWNSSNGISSCSQLYPGLTPFSEAETQVIQNVFHFNNHKIAAYINVKSGSYVHSTFKGEAVLYPKGYTDNVDDDDLYLDLKGEIGEVMRNISFRSMSITVDSLHSWYGPISGSSVDYASSEYGVPIALEFVMQSYEYEFNFQTFKHELAYDSLNVIWGKIIWTVFDSIWKNQQQDGNS